MLSVSVIHNMEILSQKDLCCMESVNSRINIRGRNDFGDLGHVTTKKKCM
jgi:hypothetical protein